MESILRDLRIAARGLRQRPGFAAAAVATLALGIGATTTVFSVAYGVLLRPLPFPSADRFVRIVQPIELNGNSARAGLSADQFANLRERATTLEAVGSWANASRTLTGIDVPVRLSGAAVDAVLFSGLGVLPSIGRAFEDQDSFPGADPVVMLSDRTWRRYFRADTTILERRITLSGVQTRVIGVMPAVFRFPSLATASGGRDSTEQLAEVPEFWLPATPFSRTGPSQGFSLFQSFALLKRGATLIQARAEVQAIAGPLPNGRQHAIEVVGAADEMALPYERVLLVFQAGVVLILMIAAVNVINLLVARDTGRRREVAIRRALGASRGRITREGISESFVLALCGGLLGSGLAYLLTAGLQLLPPHILPRLRDIRVDGAVLLFAFGVSTATGVIVGLFSTVQTAGVDPGAWLHGRAEPVSSRHRVWRPASALVVLQIAAATILVTAAGLLVNSFVRLTHVDLGYEPAGVLTFQIELPRARYGTAEGWNSFYDGLAHDVRGLAGVDFVAAESPFAVGFDPLVIDGQLVGKADVRFRTVTPDYFRALRQPVLEGREFLSEEARGQSPVVMVNEAFVRRYITGSPALGRRVAWGDRIGTREIVGVVANSRQTFTGSHEAVMYLPPRDNNPMTTPTIIVRASTDAAAVMSTARNTIRQLDPALAAYNITTLDEALAQLSAMSRFQGLLSLACAIVALALAAVGLYGVLAQSVRARWHELGIRLALGATASNVLAEVMRQGLAVASVGVLLGLLGGYLTTQVLSSLLFGVQPRDTATFVISSVVFMAVAAMACYFPARHATKVDPAVALRAE